MIITKKFTMALDQRGVAPVVDAVQDDSFTRQVEITLTYKGQPWEIPGDATAAIRFKKPDGKAGLYDTLPDGETAYTFSGNVVTVMLAPEVLTAAGRVDAAVVLYQGTEVLGLFPFIVSVALNPAGRQSVSNNYYYLQTWDDVNAAIRQLSEAVDEMIKNGEYYSPVVTSPEEGTLKFSFTPSVTGMPIPEASIIKLPSVLKGDPGATGPRGYGIGVSVAEYGAVGDGATDDTAAFQEALANERVVFVPGGTYVLSGELKIGNACTLELSQDAVLDFTQTTGNCITLGLSSFLKGNHATVRVPYAFEGNVVSADTASTELDEIYTIPPWKKWDPQWKYGRYITDLNITKPDSRGFHYSLNGDTCGTAVYIRADGTDDTHYMWGLHYSGLRIAGAFSYGVHGLCENDGWLHEMRVDAFITGCEIGVLLESCNNAYISAVIQPCTALALDSATSTVYAKHGIKLVNSKNADLSGSRVWDWNEKGTLWTADGEYQHIAMYGDCSGMIVNDFVCYHTAGTFNDTRNRIYTDTPSNLERMTILQEPITRWFKPVDGVPYFSDGLNEKKLITEAELATYFDTDVVKSFTDALAVATDEDGNVFNDIGYKPGYRFTSLGTGTDLTASAYYMTTGFIPVEPGSMVYCKDLKFNDTTKTYAGIVYYNSSKARFSNMGIANVVNGNVDYVTGYAETEDGCSFQIASSATLSNNDLAYVRFVFPTSGVGTNPMISIDEEIAYKNEGFLADGIKVKGDSLLLYSPSGKAFKLTVSEDGTLATEAVTI